MDLEYIKTVGWICIIAGLMVSFGSHVIYKSAPKNSFFKKHNLIWVLNIIAVVAVMLMFWDNFHTWEKRIGGGIIIFTFSYSFYFMFGKKVVDRIKEKGNDQIEDKLK